MNINNEINMSWNLELEFKQDYFKKINNFLKNEKDKVIFPPKNKIFAAFDLCKWEDLKVVIIGQDPYHNEHQAHGLAFSVLVEKLPPSLKNIYKEIESEYGYEMPKNNGNLESWAKQGVLLLNTALTVEKNKPGSHAKIGWHTFTENIIKKISTEKNNVVFVLWGNHAHQFKELINEEKHEILESSHPSPFSARKSFFGSNHFVKINDYLKKHNKRVIEWKIK